MHLISYYFVYVLEGDLSHWGCDQIWLGGWTLCHPSWSSNQHVSIRYVARGLDDQIGHCRWKYQHTSNPDEPCLSSWMSASLSRILTVSSSLSGWLFSGRVAHEMMWPLPTSKQTSIVSPSSSTRTSGWPASRTCSLASFSQDCSSDDQTQA